MTRTERLLAMLQFLRSRRRPVSAAELADRFSVTERTIYRDIASLVGQGAHIEGAPGVGYVLMSGYFLPPLGFSSEEAAALMLGLRFVERRGDADLAEAAASARAKLETVCDSGFDPASSLGAPLLAGPGAAAQALHLGAVRKALAAERKLRIVYFDGEGRRSERVVWPVALGWFDEAEVLAAWCEAKGAFRNFRIDRIVKTETLDERPGRTRRHLLSEYRKIEPGILL